MKPMDDAPAIEVRRCRVDDWKDVRRLHVQMALAFPLLIDVELNKVLATRDDHWRDYVRTCASDSDQAIFLADVVGDRCVGMGHVGLEGILARPSMLFVEQSWRRRGIGRSLAAAQVRWAKAAGATELTCHIPDESHAAQLAESVGLSRTEEVYVTRQRIKERKWIARSVPDAGDPLGF
jgi:GNAT superfamily N-acetyltransferase